MTYASLLARRDQDVGFRLRISGIKYYWVSSSDVPAISDSAGGTDYTRVVGAFAAAPSTMPQSAHPLKQPVALSTDVELIDIDDALTDLWATEREYPRVFLASNLTAAATDVEVVAGSTAEGLASFPAAGFCYVDGETIEYPAIDSIASPPTIGDTGGGDPCIRGKFAEDLVATDVAHSQYLLANSQLARPVFGYVPHLWYRECMLEIIDLYNTANTEVIARGFLVEPQWDGQEIFRFRISNYIHKLQSQVWRRTEVKGVLTRDFSPKLTRLTSLAGIISGRSRVSIADTKAGVTESLYVDSYETLEIAKGSGFIAFAGLPSADVKWLPVPHYYLLIGGDDGEIVAVNDWTGASTPGSDYFTVTLRGCFGTPVGKDNSGVWTKGTPVQFLCALAGDVSYQRMAKTFETYDSSPPADSTWTLDLKAEQQTNPALAGVNPINAFLMLAISTGTGTNYSGSGTNYDVLPTYYGIGIDQGRIDIAAFEEFKSLFCSENTRQHIYLAKEPMKLIDMVVTDIQAIYGGMIYATYDGTITIASFTKKLPNSTVTTVAQADIISLDVIGVQDVFNSINIIFDQWPSQQESVVRAADYRRRDAMGENPAPEITSNSLRGKGYKCSRRFSGENVVYNQTVSYLRILGNGAPIIQMTLTAKHLDLAPRGYIKFTHPGPPQIIAASRGFSDQLAMVLETAPSEEDSEIQIKAMILKDIKSCLWSPSAEISSVTPGAPADTFIIKDQVFNLNSTTSDRQIAFWSSGTKIRVWDANMTAFDQRIVSTFNALTGEIVLTVGSAKLVANNRITWDDYDTNRTGGTTQYARSVTEEWYGCFADSDGTLGATSRPPFIWWG